MVEPLVVTLFGAAPGEIGGNRVLLEWPKRRTVLLDFVSLANARDQRQDGQFFEASRLKLLAKDIVLKDAEMTKAGELLLPAFHGV